MTEKTFTDESLRETISKFELGGHERNATAYVDGGRQVNPHLGDNMFGLPTIHASITYKFENGLQIKAVPVTVKKLPNTENNQRVSLEDHLGFKKAENEDIADYRKRESEAEKDFKEKMNAWREKFPNYKRSEKHKKSESGASLISMAEIERPTKKLIGMTLGGPKHQLGILIANYEDTECLTARLKSAVVTYQPLEATMNYSMLKTTTDIKEGDLTKIMDQLKEKYQVETSYKYGEELKGPAIGNTCLARGNPLSKEYQNNIFSLPLTAEMSVDEMMGAIRNVYQAGEAFMQGYNILREERDIRIRHEENVEKRRQTSVLRKF